MNSPQEGLFESLEASQHRQLNARFYTFVKKMYLWMIPTKNLLLLLNNRIRGPDLNDAGRVSAEIRLPGGWGEGDRLGPNNVDGLRRRALGRAGGVRGKEIARRMMRWLQFNAALLVKFRNTFENGIWLKKNVNRTLSDYHCMHQLYCRVNKLIHVE